MHAIFTRLERRKLSSSAELLHRPLQFQLKTPIGGGTWDDAEGFGPGFGRRRHHPFKKGRTEGEEMTGRWSLTALCTHSQRDEIACWEWNEVSPARRVDAAVVGQKDFVPEVGGLLL